MLLLMCETRPPFNSDHVGVVERLLHNAQGAAEAGDNDRSTCQYER